MKYIQITALLVAIYMLTGCFGNSSSKDNQKQEKDSASLIAKEYGSSTEHEDFHQFLEQFNTQRTFQYQRIVFPISSSSADEDEIALTPEEKMIEKQDWELLDLSYDSTYATRDYDKYIQTVMFREDTAHVSLRGVDNGIYADYYFKMIDGEWYLVMLVE